MFYLCISPVLALLLTPYPMLGRPVLLFRHRIHRARAHAQPLASSDLAQVAPSELVSELLAAVLPRRSASERSPLERQRIEDLCKALEDIGAGEKYLTDARYTSTAGRSGSGDPVLWDNYEVAYFDRSVDGGRGNATGGPGGAPQRGIRGLRLKLLGALFSLRFSLQILQAPRTVVNFVGFRFLGLPGTVTARGEYEPLNRTAIVAAQDAHGTELREGTSVRITFGPPRVSVFGARRLGFGFELGGNAVQPPVDLCFTYVDERVRLGLAARGGRFVFTRGGLASLPFADEWQACLARPPLRKRGIAVLLAAATTLAAAVAFVASLVCMT